VGRVGGGRGRGRVVTWGAGGGWGRGPIGGPHLSAGRERRKGRDK
jgi:hypothetical protein